MSAMQFSMRSKPTTNPEQTRNTVASEDSSHKFRSTIGRNTTMDSNLDFGDQKERMRQFEAEHAPQCKVLKTMSPKKYARPVDLSDIQYSTSKPKMEPRAHGPHFGNIPSTNYLDTRNISLNSMRNLEKIDEIIESHTKRPIPKGIPRDSHDLTNMRHHRIETPEPERTTKTRSSQRLRLSSAGERSIRNKSEKRFDRISERSSPSVNDRSKSPAKGSSQGKVTTGRDDDQIKKLISTNIYKQVLEDQDIVIMEGTLVKWHPGMHLSYIKRFVQITRREIRWFKTKLAAYAWKAKPIYTVGTHEITGIAKVNMKIPNVIPKQFKEPFKKVEKYYHFEIFTLLDEVTSFPEEAMYRGVKPEDLDKPRNPYDATFKVLNVKEFLKKHLMCYPAKYDGEKPPSMKNKFLEYYPYQFEQTPMNAKAMASKRTFSLKMLDIINEVNVRTQHFKDRQSNREETQFAVIEKPRVLGEKTWKKTIDDFASWTGREREWFFGEYRLLFCTESEREREVWITVLNWVCDLHQNH